MASRATAALAREQQLLLTDLVLAECVYVLDSFYEVERPRVAELMRSALSLRSIKTIDPASLLRALEIYELDRVDFAEAYLVAQAETTGVRESPVLRPLDRQDQIRHPTRTLTNGPGDPRSPPSSPQGCCEAARGCRRQPLMFGASKSRSAAVLSCESWTSTRTLIASTERA
jgi:predicted nucleic-acid-binding protein